MTPKLTWRQVHGRRLARGYLSGPGSDDPVGMVRRVAGIQAQVMSAAEHAVGVRLADPSLARVRDELWQRRGLVKTYGMRGTLHLLPADELSLWSAAMRNHPAGGAGNWHAGFGLTVRQGEAVLAAMRDALDGRQLSRQDLAAAVAERVGDWARGPLASTWGEMITPAAYHGVLCFGPGQGGKVGFVRVDQWLGRTLPPYPGDALAEVLRRYLYAYGPATVADVARWFAVRVPDARKLLAAIGDEVAEVDVEGRRAVALRADLDQPFDDGPAGVRLVPQYDAYVLGSGPREQIVPRPRCDRIYRHGRGRYEGAVAQHVVLVDGVVAGMWQRRARRGKLWLRIEMFQDLPGPWHGRLVTEAERVAAFFGADLDLEFGPLVPSR